MLEASLGLGLFLSVIFSETIGLAAGGMIVPGYLALEIQYPGRVATTVFCALVTYAVVQLAARFMLIYGRRRTAAMILVGFLVRYLISGTIATYLPAMSQTLDIIGYIIPGLIAVWMARQGIIETLSVGLSAAVMIRLVLMLLTEWGVLA